MAEYLGLVIVAIIVIGAISLFHKAHSSHKPSEYDLHVDAAHEAIHDAILDVHEDVKKLADKVEHGKKDEAPGQVKKEDRG